MRDEPLDIVMVGADRDLKIERRESGLARSSALAPLRQAPVAETIRISTAASARLSGRD